MDVKSKLNSIVQAVQDVVDDYRTPESFKKGEAFEKFVREEVFPKDTYQLIHKTSKYKQNSKDFAEDSLNPDFKLRCKERQKEFHVEAKYRSNLYNNNKLFYNPAQFDRYKDLDKATTVFVALGLGGKPSSPLDVCVIPMRDIKSPVVSDEFLADYVLSLSPISPKVLWRLLGNTGAAQQKISSKQKGHCVRCGNEIELNPDHPLCPSCYQKWSEFKNPDYPEKVCHFCGQKKEGVTFAKPACYACYKSRQ